MSKFKEKRFELYFPVFTYSVEIVITNDLKKSRSSDDEFIGHPLKGGTKFTSGLHSYNKEYPKSFIYLLNRLDINTVAHESYHCVSRMMTSIGAEIEEEVMAYHIGYIVEKIYKFYKIKNE